MKFIFYIGKVIKKTFGTYALEQILGCVPYCA